MWGLSAPQDLPYLHYGAGFVATTHGNIPDSAWKGQWILEAESSESSLPGRLPRNASLRLTPIQSTALSQPWATPLCEMDDPGQPACTKQRWNSIGHVGISGVQGRVLVFRFGCNSKVLKSIMLQKLFLAELALTQGRQTVTGKHLTHFDGQG